MSAIGGSIDGRQVGQDDKNHKTQQSQPTDHGHLTKDKNKIQDEESTFCAYKLAKQSEEVKKKQQLFWGDLMKLTNK